MILRRKGFDSNGNESVDKEYVREMDHSGVNERRRLTMMIGAKQNRSEREREREELWVVRLRLRLGGEEEEARTGNCATFFSFFFFFFFRFFFFLLLLLYVKVFSNFFWESALTHTQISIV